jgi:hypothetical protein
MLAQPANEIEDIGIAPHPLREAFKPGEGIDAVHVRPFAAHIAIDAVGVGPIRFRRNGVESLLINQALGDESAFAVEFVRPMTGFAEQNKTGVAHHLDERIVVVRRTGQRVGGAADAIG